MSLRLRALLTISLVSLASIGIAAFPQQASSSDSFGGSFDDPPATEGSDNFGGSFGEAGATEPAPSREPTGDDSFGGSFGEGGGQGTAPGGEDDFGGSFGEGGAASEPEVSGSDAGGPEPGGGDDFGAGSFDEPAGAGIPPGTPPGPPPRKPDVAVEKPPAQEPGTPEGAASQTGPQIDPGILAFETRDFGVPPSNRLRGSQFHAPTPTSLPGGQLITTQNLANAMNAGQQFLLIDVLGSDYSLPNAYQAPAMAQPGSFRDRIQQQTVQWLGQISGNNRAMPIVVLCSDPHCWLSYNAGLRALAAGYSEVYWYRGGHQAWNMAGLPMVPSGF